MPTNRTRRARTWQPDLDEHRRQQLLDGPDAVLIAGVGYLADAKVARADLMTAAQHAEMLAAMEADWHAHGASLSAGHTTTPWAATEFGEV